VGRKSKIANNAIYFSGRNALGNAIDIIDSDDIDISNNIIFTPTSESIAIVLSDHVTIDGNTITGGVTYAINMISNSVFLHKPSNLANLLAWLKKHGPKHANTSNIKITNNFMSQNRYGIAANNVDHLTVTDNYFSQRFEDASSRMFWTDNHNLLRNVTALTWANNYYKEAFTQVNSGDNSLTDNIVPYPATGGVVLSLR